MNANIFIEKESLIGLDESSLDLIESGRFYLYKIDNTISGYGYARYLLKPSDREFYLLNDQGLAISHHLANYPINNEPRVLIKSATSNNDFFNSLFK